MTTHDKTMRYEEALEAANQALSEAINEAHAEFQSAKDRGEPIETAYRIYTRTIDEADSACMRARRAAQKAYLDD